MIAKLCDQCGSKLSVDNDATHGLVLVLHPSLGRVEIVRHGSGHLCEHCLRTSLAEVQVPQLSTLSVARRRAANESH